MPPLFDFETVLVRKTDLSNLPGLTHIEVTLNNVSGLCVARRLQTFLAGEDKTSGVGLTWDRTTRCAILRTFVTGTFTCDAVGYIRGLFGQQAQTFA